MVAERLVTSLARPGGNITGISLLSPELDGKRQDILIEALPGARRIAAMSDSKVTSRNICRLCSERVNRVVSRSRFLVSASRTKLRPQSMLRRRRGQRRLIFWRRRCSRFRALATIKSLWNGLTRFAFHQFFSGLRQRKQVRFLAMARVLPTSTVSGRKS